MIDNQAIINWMSSCAEKMAQNADILTRLDAEIGDGDHGINVNRGFQAVIKKVSEGGETDLGKLFKTIGMALVSSVGGASGPLYGTLFLQMGSSTTGKSVLTPEEWVDALNAGVNGIAARGKSELGDKTMLDALLPAVEAMQNTILAGKPFNEALETGLLAAEQGVKQTIPLQAKKGRASYLGERSINHQDPGATSACLIIESAAQTLS